MAGLKAGDRMESALQRLLDDVDKGHLRGMQAEMHRCAARCCDDQRATVQAVHHCVEQCHSGFRQANSYVEGEFYHLQSRLQRCVLSCNDKVRDMVAGKPSEAQILEYSSEFDSCVETCVDKHVALIPAMFKKMQEVLNSKTFEATTTAAALAP